MSSAQIPRRDGASAPSSPIADQSPDDLAIPYGAGRFDLKRTRRPRLKKFDYTGLHTYHLVTVTHGRAHVLHGADALRSCAAVTRAAFRHSFEILAYVVMPDHVHLLAQGMTGDSNAIRLIQYFKQITGYAYKQRTGDGLWQQGFFDRVIRRDEDIRSIAEYIIENPRRAGLVNEDGVWPYFGGTLVASARGRDSE